MNTKLFISSIFLSTSLSLFAQKSATITLHTDQSEQIIPKEIYGQFAEHLGTCIYGGLWVGENSDIPNINGYRTDVFNGAQKKNKRLRKQTFVFLGPLTNESPTLAGSRARMREIRE